MNVVPCCSGYVTPEQARRFPAAASGGPPGPDKRAARNYIEWAKSRSRNSFVPEMELSDLYSEKILNIAANQPVPGRLAEPDASARRVSRICGSTIEVDIAIRDGVIAGYGHEISACALGQTSAAIVATNAVGSTPDEIRLVRTQMYAMLKADGAPPAGRWDDLKYLEPVREYRPRHTSTLLVFDAVVDALDAIEGRKTPAPEPLAAAS
jgi:NifU-like protein involved in Fe-S cluster formation